MPFPKREVAEVGTLANPEQGTSTAMSMCLNPRYYYVARLVLALVKTC